MELHNLMLLLYCLPLKRCCMAEDIKENAMAGGTPARLRGLAANGNSISPTLEEVASAMPVATMEEKGMASAGQGRVEYSIVGEGSVDIPLPYYGIFLFVSEEQWLQSPIPFSLL